VTTNPDDELRRILTESLPELYPPDAPIPEHEGTFLILFPVPSLPEEEKARVLDQVFDLSNEITFFERRQGNTTLRLYRDNEFRIVYYHHNPTFGERIVNIDCGDIKTERTNTRGFFLAIKWAAAQNGLFVGVYHPDPTHAEIRKAVVLTNDKLRLIKIAVREFENVLNATDREEETHQFLKDNPALLGLTSTIDPISKFKLGDDYITDFVINEIPEGYVLIEIERPGLQLFRRIRDNRPPERHTELNHAIEQIENWKAWVGRYHSYVSNKLPGIAPSPLCWLIAGRSTNLSDPERTRLSEINQEYRNSYRIFTYDDLLNRIKAVINKF
jgi:hypothetical protein